MATLPRPTTAPRPRRGLTLVTLLCCIAGSGCSGCGSKAPLGFVPDDALLVVEVPSLEKTLNNVSAVVEKFRGATMAAAMLASQKSALVRELGFDPEKPETLKKRGIDPKAGLVAMVTQERGFALVMPVLDQVALEKYVRQQLNKQYAGGLTFEEKKLHGVKVTLLLRQGSSRPLGGWAFVRKHVIVGTEVNDGKVGLLIARLARLKRTIKDDADFKELREKVGECDVLFYAGAKAARKKFKAHTDELVKHASDVRRRSIKEEREITSGLLSFVRGWALGISASADGLRLRGFVGMPDGKLKTLRAILSGKDDAPEFGKFISPDALLVGRFSLDAKRLMDKVLEMMPPRRKRDVYRAIESWEQQNNISLDKDVLARLGGRFAGAIFAPPSDAMKGALLPRRLARSLPFVALAQITDPKETAKLLTRLERFLVLRRLEVRTRSVGERKVYTLERDEKPFISWTVVDKVLVVASASRLEPTVKLVEKGGENVLGQIKSSRAKGLLRSDDGVVVYHDFARLSDTARSLPLPPPAKLMVGQASQILGKLRDITLAAEVKSAGILGELVLRLR